VRDAFGLFAKLQLLTIPSGACRPEAAALCN
jgi:hypothetical protein